MFWVSIILLVVSFAMLYYGAEYSLEGAEVFGKKLGLSPLVIGMVLIGFGTSLPEAFVGHISALNGKGSIALGSLLGSNIANMFFILGVSSLFCSLELKNKNLRPSLLIHFLLSAILWFVFGKESLTLTSTLPLFFIVILYMYFIYRDIKSSSLPSGLSEDQALNVEIEKEKLGLVFFKTLVGFGLLFAGGEVLVSNAIKVCKALGISEYIISAIVVALGTSFPELVTSLIAAIKKKESDLIIGNILGSNIFNCGLILGSLGVYNIKISEVLTFEIIALILGSLYLLILNSLKMNLNKMAGTLLLIGHALALGHWLKLI